MAKNKKYSDNDTLSMMLSGMETLKAAEEQKDEVQPQEKVSISENHTQTTTEETTATATEKKSREKKSENKIKTVGDNGLKENSFSHKVILKNTPKAPRSEQKRQVSFRLSNKAAGYLDKMTYDSGRSTNDVLNRILESLDEDYITKK